MAAAEEEEEEMDLYSVPASSVEQVKSRRRFSSRHIKSEVKGNLDNRDNR